MGCGASSSVIEYAQVAPGGLGGLRRRGSASGEDEVEAFVARHLPTPVMDRLWVVHRQAMATSCIKEFMGLLGLRAKDMQGGMRVFLKLTKAPGSPLGKLEDMLRLPAGASGQPNPLAVRFFNAVASTSADGASQGLTYRTFMFFLAIFKHVPLAQPEKLRFWFTIMILANVPQVPGPPRPAPSGPAVPQHEAQRPTPRRCCSRPAASGQRLRARLAAHLSHAPALSVLCA